MAVKDNIQTLGGRLAPKQWVRSSENKEEEKLGNGEEQGWRDTVMMQRKSEWTTDCPNRAEHMEELVRLVTRDVQLMKWQNMSVVFICASMGSLGSKIVLGNCG